METALGAANWLLNKVLQKLSDDVVAAFVSSKELGLDYEKIETQLLETQAVLVEAQRRDVSDNRGLQGLLQKLSEKADEAEDALDELHYFMIQDKLDGTREAIPDLGDGLSNDVQHFRHAARHTTGNWLTYFSCCRSQDVAEKVGKLSFDRVEMSKKIKEAIEGMHFLCDKITRMLQYAGPQRIGATYSLKRPPTSSVITQDMLYGRDAIFSKTINDMISGMCHETLSIIPIVGPGGIGKTTFSQHLYNHETIKKHFSVRVWVRVPVNFDVEKLTQEILSCMPGVENEDRIERSPHNLGYLHGRIKQRLESKRFLLVLDDIWKCNKKSDWDTLLAPFSNEETKGNMVLVTTRFPKIAAMVKKATNPIELQGLEPDEFWKFFQVCVFGDVKDDQDKDELIGIAKAISAKLKCSPLAARTVGQSLQNNQTREHWMKILNDKKWKNLNNEDDIMPALKISYDYLPFHLKKCFSYCSLFPEDHTFDRLEITRFWISIGVLDSWGQNGRLEDIGSQYLDELVDNGFLTKRDGNCYAMHDLFYELSQSVSSQECAHINLHFKAVSISRSIRHLSISMENECSESFFEEMHKLLEKIKIEKLRSFMIFGDYNSEIDSVICFRDIFKELKGLRVLYTFIDYPEYWPYSFSKLIHLQYLKIESLGWLGSGRLPVTISRFYHLKFLNLEKWHGSYDLPKDMNRLVNLRHFLAQKEFHSNVLEVGKMECLEELKEFQIKKDGAGFEISELGKLTELGGTLGICNLEKVETREEASKAELMKKRNLRKLRLVWSRDQRTIGADVIDGLQPHPNLRKLTIVNHGCSRGPSWLSHHASGTTSLESLHLDNISWDNLPPLDLLPNLKKLKLKNIAGMRRFGPDFGGAADKSLINLKTIVFHSMPQLVDWVGEADCHLFPRLERIECVDCPNLTDLPFSVFTGPPTQDSIWFPNLRSLDIKNCPKVHLPLIPYTSTLAGVSVREGSRANLLYMKDEGSLTVNGYKGALNFDNLAEVKSVRIENEPHILLTDLQKLTSLRKLHVCGYDNMLSGKLDGSVVRSVQMLTLDEFNATGRLLSNVVKCFPALSALSMIGSSLFPTIQEVQFPYSSSLRKVQFYDCGNLILSMEDGGLKGLSSLESLNVSRCGRIFSMWSEGIEPFPDSLRELVISEEPSMKSMVMLSNLKSLIHLELRACNNLQVDGFDRCIAFNLKKLVVDSWFSEAGFSSQQEPISPGFSSVAGRLLSEVVLMGPMSAGSFQLEHLHVDCIMALLVVPICRHLSGTLSTLHFYGDTLTQRLSKEQEEALPLLRALKELKFVGCTELVSLPERLYRIHSLKLLYVSGCPQIKSLPKNGLPASLEVLQFLECSYEIYYEIYRKQSRIKATYPELDVRVTIDSQASTKELGV